MSQTYQPSGKIPLSSIGIFLLLCVTAFPLLGTLYTLAIWYIPFIYINFLILAGTAFLVGVLMSRVVVRGGKLRNVKFAVLLSILAGCVTIYTSWAVWVDLVLNSGEVIGGSRIGITVSSISFDQVLSIAFRPKAMFELIAEINEFGTWGLRSATVSGSFLTIIWVIEAFGMIVIAAFLGYSNAQEPFCESSNKWFDLSSSKSLTFIDQPDVLIGQLEIGNIDQLSQLKVIDPILEMQHSQFNLYSSDNEEQYVSVINRTKKVNKDGEAEFVDDYLIEYMAIPIKVKNELQKFI